MRLPHFNLTRQLRYSVLWAAVLSLFAVVCAAQPDPPDEAGRISILEGNVSVQPPGTDDWGQAYPNLPVGPGDRIATDQNGRVEIQVGQSYLRIGPNSDVTLVSYAPDEITFGLGQGSVHVRSFGFLQGQGLDISTANGDARMEQPGEMRVDAMPDQGATVFTSFNSSLFVTGAGGFEQPMEGWRALELAGTNPVYPEWLQPTQLDELDAWSQDRDRMVLNAAAYQYVSPEVTGAADLDQNGDWISDSDYGPIWFPRVVAGWAPYRDGHWINRDPWGWVWVEDEPWGYAPFHYGRWVFYRNRWGWVPGPRHEHPVWSPALVVFAGGIHAGGTGVAAWFPLGPGEPYRPWYRCSPRYIDRVNITNIRETRVVRVQRTYANIENVNYVNRTIGFSAVRQSDFASGRPVERSAVQVDRRQFDHVQVIDHPAPVMQQSIITRPVAQPVRVAGARPMFINRQGMQISAAPGARAQQPPVRPAPPAAARPLPGRTVAEPPPGSRFQNRAPAGNSEQQQRQPVAPGVQPRGRPMPSPSARQEYGNPQAPQQPRSAPPETNNRQEYRPQQPYRRDETAPPPRNNVQPFRPSPVAPRAQPNPPESRPQGRPQQAPQNDRHASDQRPNKEQQQKKDEKRKPE